MGNDMELTNMLTFAYMADTEEAKELDESKTDVQRKVLKSYQDTLRDTDTINSIGSWSCTHEPWITIYNKLEQNLTAFFECQDKNEVVIAVAGTNFTSHFDWFVEDLEVSALIPWNKEIVNSGDKNTETGENGYVSQGTARALHTSWTQVIGDSDDPDNQDPSETPIDYLQTLLKDKLAAPLTLYVTGHSLGGAISPVLAQAIADHVGDWDLDGADLSNLTIKTYPFAGPTPGDDRFLDYVYNHAERKVEVYSTVNLNDVVPHAWESETQDDTMEHLKLQNIASVYSSVLSAEKEEYKCIVEATVQMLIDFSEHAKSNGHNYKRWQNENSFSGKLSEFGKIEKAGILGFNDTIRAHVSLKGKENVKAALLNITGVSKVEELKPYLQYFCSFLVHLAIQHISAYKKQYINDQVTTVLRDKASVSIINPIDIIKKLEAGLSVLDTLFLKVADHNPADISN